MDMPLHLSQVLEEEFKMLYGDSPGGANWSFEENHFSNPKELALKLCRSGDELSNYLREKISPQLKEALAGPPDPAPLPPALVTSLRDSLNQALADKNLYDMARFSRVSLSAETRELVNYELHGAELEHRNRLLLEQAYPDEIKDIHDIRLAAVHGKIHERAKRRDRPGKRTALCLSGGGIRSATFALGVMQQLARFGALEKFDYLSTVSGGGYVGSWFTAWVHRHPRGTAGVVEELRAKPESAVEPEPGQVRHLRSYSNYLSPKLGFLSADTWTLVATYLRNLILNWLVLIPLLAGVLIFPRLGVAVARFEPSDSTRTAVLGMAFLLMVVAVAYVGMFRPSLQENRNQRGGRLGAKENQEGFLKWCLLPLLSSGILLSFYWIWWHESSGGALADFINPYGLARWQAFVLFGTGVHLLSWLAYSLRLNHFSPVEFAIVLVSGATGGLFLWVVTVVLPAATARQFPAVYVTFAVPLLMAVFLLAATLFIGLANCYTTDGDREWWARFGGWILAGCLGWAGLSALVLFGPLALGYAWKTLTSVGIVSAALAVLTGRSGVTAAKSQSKNSAGVPGWIFEHAAVVAAPIAVAFLLALLSLGTTALLELSAIQNWVLENRSRLAPRELSMDYFGHLTVIYTTRWEASAIFILAALGLGGLMGTVIDINEFSLHAMYRNRLVRAFLGASREKRRPNPFTGFDPWDDIEMREMHPDAVRPASIGNFHEFLLRLKDPKDSDSQELAKCLSRNTRDWVDSYKGTSSISNVLRHGLIDDLNKAFYSASAERRLVLKKAFSNLISDAIAENRIQKPMHVVNIALNLVGGHNLAWQERKAESFTVTALHSGSYHLGYRRSEKYGGKTKRNTISLGTAMTISGAAASPNMGYHSSPAVTFLMTLFNARLGWWLGNPGVYGRKTYNTASPRFAVWPMIEEAFGLTDNTRPYVYLSDGGHFDNLGLLEMVLRRCHLIVVCDAGRDPACTFEDMANAIRKVRIDLGVPIERIEKFEIYSKTSGKVGKYCAIGEIDYRSVDGEGAENGTLIYIKPCFYGDEPIDVFHYAHSSKDFPHESTADQFFSESQWESYRMLGYHTMREICGNHTRESDLDGFVLCVRKYLKTVSADPSMPVEYAPDPAIHRVQHEG
jgi:hypothetical protein